MSAPDTIQQKEENRISVVGPPLFCVQHKWAYLRTRVCDREQVRQYDRGKQVNGAGARTHE